MKGNGGLSVWFFQERAPNEGAFSERVQSIFRGELGLQRTYPWILFGPYLALIAWYFPLERGRLGRNLPLHLAVCVVFASVSQALNLRTPAPRGRFLVVNLNPALAPGAAPSVGNDPAARGEVEDFPESEEPIRVRRLRPPSPPGGRKVSVRSTALDLLAYGVISGLVHSVNFYGRLRERERRALFLESNLAKARLNTLKAQLQPHFLFNSLNAITALLRRDPPLAENTLINLSELLRLSLSRSEKQECALGDELEFVRHYLEIQKTRFGEKLCVEQEIDPQSLECLVPTLVLQPLVENAIRHGIEPSENAGVVRVSTSRKEEKLVLTVKDNGVGLAVSTHSSAPPTLIARTGTAIGLANLRERLEALYGTHQKLELTPGAAGGAIVRVEIPWRQREKNGAER